MSRAGNADPRGEAASIHDAIRDAYAGLGLAYADHASAAGSIEDITSLIEACGQPRKVLQVGGGPGATTMLLALAFPDARIVRVDPNLPVHGAGGQPAEQVARQAAQALGVEPQIEFVTGGFSETITSRSVIEADLRTGRVQARMAGPEACAREQPFDVAFVDGLTSAEARASDIRLAASALAPDGVIVSTDTVGPCGATVRAGVYEFLRYFPAYTFAHDRLDDTRRTLGFLKRREAGWAGDRTPADAHNIPEPGMDVRDRLADLVALTVGRRPILEVAIGAPVLGPAFRARGLASRTLRLTGADWNTHFFDPVIDQISNALDHTPDSVLFSADLMDYAPDEFAGRLFARIEERRSPALFFATPPGEAHAAGPRSRPAARIVDLAASQNVRAFAPAALEFERARHEGAGRSGWLGGSSRHASFLMFSRGDPGRDARGRNIPEVTPQAVQVREQVELQRIWAEAALQRSLEIATVRRSTAERERDDALLRWREAEQAVDQERADAERSQASLRSDVERMRGDLSALEQDKAAAIAGKNQADKLRADAEAALRAELDGVRAEVGRLVAARDAALADVGAATARAAQAAEGDAARIRELEADVARWRAERDALAIERDEALAAQRRAESEREGVEVEFRSQLQGAEEALQQARLSGQDRENELLARVSEAEAQAGDEAELAELRRQLGEARADLDDLRSRHEHELQARDLELEELRAELSEESLQVLDAQCREVDAQASLEGIANHIAVTHDALQRFRADPAGFEGEQVPYPVRADIFEGQNVNLVARVSQLHGRSADLSREVAEELERLGRARGEYDEWKRRQLEISETSHDEALRVAKSEFQTQFWTQERLNSRVASGIAFNNRLLADIIALTPGFVEDPARLSAEVAELELTANAAVSLDALEQIAAQEKRLLHLLHTMEAELGAGDPAADFEPVGEGVSGFHVEELLDDRDEPTTSLFAEEPVVRPSAFTSVGDGGGRSSENVAREMEADELGDPSKVLEFTRPERVPGETGWSFGGTPIWRVERRAADTGRRRMPWSGLWDRIRTYPETARLVRLQQALRNELVTCPVNPRVFDVDLYQAQGRSEPYAEPLHHYLVEGEKAGWSPLAGFDPAYYATQVGDLGGWKGSLLRHFLSRGVHDRRSPSKMLEGLSDRATAAGMEPLEYFYHWENAARGTWWDDLDRDD